MLLFFLSPEATRKENESTGMFLFSFGSVRPSVRPSVRRLGGRGWRASLALSGGGCSGWTKKKSLHKPLYRATARHL